MEMHSPTEVSVEGPPVSPGPPSPPAMQGRRSRFHLVLASCVVLGLVAGGGIWLAGGPSVALAHLLGYALHADRSHTEIGVVRADEPVTVRTTVRNIRWQATTIIGVETSCGCATVNLDALPVELGPGEEYEVILTVKPSQAAKGQRFSFTARVFTDAPGPILTVRHTADVQ